MALRPYSRAARLALATLLLAATSAARARAAGAVLVVDPAGGGDHLTIQAAVDAAASGDTLLVKGGAQPPFVLDGKSLTISADAGAIVTVSATSAPDNVMGPLSMHSVVRNLGAGSAVVIRGLAMRGLEIADAAGTVRLEEVVAFGTAPALRAVRCAALGLERCTLDGPDGFVDASVHVFTTEGCALETVDSEVAIYDSELTGGDGRDYTATVLGDLPNTGGKSALQIAGGTGLLSGCTLIGGQGGDAGIDVFGFCTNGGAGGHGAHLVSGAPQLYVLDSPMEGGAGGAPLLPPGQCLNGGGLAGPDGDEARVDSGALARFAGFARRVRLASPVREGGAVAIEVTGVPGDAVLLLVSPAAGHVLMTARSGVLLVGAPLAIHPLGVLPPSGSLALSPLLPDLGPGVDSATIHVQVAACGGGSCVLGGASALLGLDAQF